MTNLERIRTLEPEKLLDVVVSVISCPLYNEDGRSPLYEELKWLCTEYNCNCYKCRTNRFIQWCKFEEVGKHG